MNGILKKFMQIVIFSEPYFEYSQLNIMESGVDSINAVNIIVPLKFVNYFVRIRKVYLTYFKNNLANQS